jgi:hypothetical protein
MPQTTGAVSRSQFTLEVSTTLPTWVDIGGTAVGVTFDGGEAVVGEQMTADGGYAIVATGGKVEPRDITFSCVYSEVSSEAWKTVFAAFLSNDKTIAVRWALTGAAKKLCTSVNGTAAAKVPILSCDPPELDATSGDPALFEFVVKSPALAEITVP